MKRRLVSQIYLAVLLLGIGILIVAQLRTQRHLRVVSYDRDEQALLLSELIDANLRLQDEIDLLAAQQAAYEDSDRGAILEELVAELNRMRVFNGVVEVSGPGIELLVDGPLNALDLQDLVNELRNAGAEAIMLNDHRLVVDSVFVVEGKGLVTVDGQAVQRPYHLRAIGDPDTMETAMLRPGGLIPLFRGSYSNLTVQLQEHSRLVIGVHRPRHVLRFAQAVE